MSIETRSCYCRDCGRRRRFSRPAVNHLLHFLITVLACGLWLPVWFGVCLIPRPWRCEACGETAPITFETINREPIIVAAVAMFAALVFGLIIWNA